MRNRNLKGTETKNKLAKLMEAVETLSDKNIKTYPKGGWTALKLMFLMSYLETIYIPIIRGYTSPFNESYYIDLFAGSGINDIDGTEMAGSPMISAIFANPPFDKMILVEKDQETRNSLKICMEEVAPENTWILENKGREQPDCNKVIGEITEFIDHKDGQEGRSHYLAFIDPEGMELNWETLEKLLQKKGDLIVLFDTTGVLRNLKMAKREDRGFPEKFDRFYGDRGWFKAENAEDLLKIYMEKIGIYRDIVESIKIKKDKGGSFYYHLIFATIKTKSGSPWMKGVYAIKNKIEKNYGESVERSLMVLSNKNADLLGWFEEEEGSQRKLDSF